MYADQLMNAGFNYWGTEAMMSGVTGRLLEAHIFIGVVYYQRLRHMVADKYQVRTTSVIFTIQNGLGPLPKSHPNILNVHVSSKPKFQKHSRKWF